MKKVVVFGGGTGITQLLSGIKLFPVDITAVVTVADNGRSTGILREEFDMPAVGDIRKVVLSLSDVDSKIKELLHYRFDTSSDLNGHPIGNLIMVGMYNMTGSLKESIAVMSKFLNVKHKILPLSEDNLTLMGKTEDGMVLEGEHTITEANKLIKKLYYKKEPKVLPEVLKEIEKADMIIFSMGSLYTSILPHIICKEIKTAIDKTKAKILYTCNAVTQPGETPDFAVSNHIKILNNYLGKRKVEYVVAANTTIPQHIVEKYATAEQKDLVLVDSEEVKKLNCILIESDILTIKDNMIRHKSLKLATAIFNLLME